MTRTTASTRSKAVAAAVAVLRDPLFRALQESARVAVLEQVMLLGPADVGRIAESVPQERSVVSRHLQQLHRAGLLRVQRAGRQRIYALDGAAILHKFDTIREQLGRMAVLCCPPPEAS